eukprot:2409800-Pleurochrysis_carterae.AAC.1
MAAWQLSVGGDATRGTMMWPLRRLSATHARETPKVVTICNKGCLETLGTLVRTGACGRVPRLVGG